MVVTRTSCEKRKRETERLNAYEKKRPFSRPAPTPCVSDIVAQFTPCVK